MSPTSRFGPLPPVLEETADALRAEADTPNAKIGESVVDMMQLGPGLAIDEDEKPDAMDCYCRFLAVFLCVFIVMWFLYMVSQRFA
jgi:hypothetical protein